MYAIDASVWVSRFVPVDPHYEASIAQLGALVRQGEPMVSPSLLLAEVAGAVARRTGVAELGIRAATVIEALANVRLVPTDMLLARLSARLAAELQLKGADAIYVALARRLDVPLLTWDMEQKTRGGAAITVLVPRDAQIG